LQAYYVDVVLAHAQLPEATLLELNHEHNLASLRTLSLAKGDEGMFHSALYALLWTLSPAVGTVSSEVASQHGRADSVIRFAHPRVET